jgi:hypothetical protein
MAKTDMILSQPILYGRGLMRIGSKQTLHLSPAEQEVLPPVFPKTALLRRSPNTSGNTSAIRYRRMFTAVRAGIRPHPDHHPVYLFNNIIKV